MTFIQKLRAHEGGLIRFNEIKTQHFGAPADRSPGFLSGKIGMICGKVLPAGGNGSESYAWVTLFIEENTRSVLLHEKKVEFLEMSQ